MKILKYSLFTAALLCFSGLMSSCDDDSITGAGDATIGFAQASYTYKESAGLVKIPVQVTGEPEEYPITFNVEVQIEGDEVSLDDVVLFTQLTGLKYAGNEDAPAYVEFQLIDNEEINDSRFMTLTITSASGATIANASTRVEIADNDNNPYERLWGEWTYSGVSISDGSTSTFTFTICGGLTPEEEAENADKRLVCVGYAGNSSIGGIPIVWYIDYDGEAGTCSIAGGETMFEIAADAFGLGVSTTKVVTSVLFEDELYENMSIPGSWNDECTEMTFSSEYGLVPKIYGDGEYTGYVWGQDVQIVLTRKK